MTQCSVTVYGERVRSWPCRKSATVQRGGKWYCTTHDPLHQEQVVTTRNARFKLEERLRNRAYDVKHARSELVSVLLADMQYTPQSARLLKELRKAYQEYANVSHLIDQRGIKVSSYTKDVLQGVDLPSHIIPEE